MARKESEGSYFTRSALQEIYLLRKYFDIEGTGDNVRLRGELRPDNVVPFFREYFASVRPDNLSDPKILPRPDSQRLRALYLGQPDVNLLLNLVVRHALYLDQLVLVDPIIILPHDQVLERPVAWAQVFINRALCLCALEDWIRHELIMVIPSVIHYRPEFRELIRASSTSFMPRLSPEQERQFQRQILVRLLVSVPPDSRDSLLDVVSNMGEVLSSSDRDDILDQARAYETAYPIRYRVPFDFIAEHLPEEDTVSQVFGMTLSMPLLLAPTIAEMIGAFLLFENRLTYDLLTAHHASPDGSTETMQQLALAFQGLDFPFLHNVPVDRALELRRRDYLHSFRVYLRDLWTTVSTLEGQSLDAQAMDFTDRLQAEYAILEQEWKDIRRELRLKAVASGAVAGISASTPIVFGNIDWSLIALAGLGGTLVKEIANGYLGSAGDLRETYRNPLGVFLILEHD